MKCVTCGHPVAGSGLKDKRFCSVSCAVESRVANAKGPRIDLKSKSVVKA